MIIKDCGGHGGQVGHEVLIVIFLIVLRVSKVIVKSGQCHLRFILSVRFHVFRSNNRYNPGQQYWLRVVSVHGHHAIQVHPLCREGHQDWLSTTIVISVLILIGNLVWFQVQVVSSLITIIFSMAQCSTFYLFTLTVNINCPINLRSNSKAQKQCLKRPNSSNGRDTNVFSFVKASVQFFISFVKVLGLERIILVNFTTTLITYFIWLPLPYTSYQVIFLISLTSGLTLGIAYLGWSIYFCIPVPFTLSFSTPVTFTVTLTFSVTFSITLTATFTANFTSNYPGLYLTISACLGWLIYFCLFSATFTITLQTAIRPFVLLIVRAYLGWLNLNHLTMLNLSTFTVTLTSPSVFIFRHAHTPVTFTVTLTFTFNITFNVTFTATFTANFTRTGACLGWLISFCLFLQLLPLHTCSLSHCCFLSCSFVLFSTQKLNNSVQKVPFSLYVLSSHVSIQLLLLLIS